MDKKAYCKNCRFWKGPMFTNIKCNKVIKPEQINGYNGDIISNVEYCVPSNNNKYGECQYFEQCTNIQRILRKWLML
jgi:hypothetical protein